MRDLAKPDWLAIAFAFIGCGLSVGSALYGHYGWVSDLGAFIVAIGMFIAFLGAIGKIMDRKGEGDEQ